MKKHTAKRSRIESQLRRVERELKADPSNDRCFFFSYLPRSCFDHVVPKSQNINLIDKKENLVPISQTAHNVITFGTAEEVMGLPRIKDYLQIMRVLDEDYYNRFLINRNIIRQV